MTGPRQKTSFTLKYRLTRGLLILLGLPFTRRICGIENFPKEGAFLLAANHASHVDWMFIVNRLTAILDRHIHCFATTKYFKNPLFRYYVNEEKGIWVDLKEPGRALLIGLDYLKKGEVLGTFPEGTRSPDGKIRKAKNGVAMLALCARVPIVPMGLIDTHKVLPRGAFFFHPARCEAVIGPPMKFEEYYEEYDRARGQNDQEKVTQIEDEATRKIMKEIARLSNQEYPY